MVIRVIVDLDRFRSGFEEINNDKLTVLSEDPYLSGISRSTGSEPMNDKDVANCPSLLLIARGHVILTAKRNGNDYGSQRSKCSNYSSIIFLFQLIYH